jgi:hypothetical protein
MSTTNSPAGPQTLDEVLERISSETTAGVRHGFFEFSVSGEMVKAHKCRVMVRAGPPSA